jgi:hypothetical protein
VFSGKNMGADTILLQVKEATEKVRVHTDRLRSEDHLTLADTEDLLKEIEKLYRILAVYAHTIQKQEITGDLQVHMKIMQNVSNIETSAVVEKIIEEKQEEKPVEPIKEEKVVLRQIELSINNKFRIANELFAQNQQEFLAALQQLNSINTMAEVDRYLESLRQVYKWKEENPLVKSFYALVHKRFS